MFNKFASMFRRPADAPPSVYVEGLKAAGWGEAERKELDHFIQDPIAINLLLIAYNELQENDLEPGTLNLRNMQSYFNIGAIHELPRHAFDGVQANALLVALKKAGRLNEWNSYNNGRAGDRKGGNLLTGYCVHGTLLFMSWHRVYQVLWEQIVFYKVLEVAERFGSPEYMAVARSFRLPYWDPFKPRAVRGAPGEGWTMRRVQPAAGNAEVDVWTRNRFVYDLPPIMTKRFVYIYLPDPTNPPNTIRREIANPLWGYKFPTQANMADPRLGIDKLAAPSPSDNPTPASEHFFAKNTLRQKVCTTRCPAITTGYSQHRVLNTNLNNVADAKRQKLYFILTADQGYLNMCSLNLQRTKMQVRTGNTVRFAAAPNSPRSLESLHDDYHSMLGGNSFNTGGGRIRLEVSARGSLFDSNYGGFDPMFFMWHGVIEKWMCLWQLRWPGRWWNPRFLEVPTPPAPGPLPPVVAGQPHLQNEHVDPWYDGLFEGTPALDRVDAAPDGELATEGATGPNFWRTYGTWERANTPLLPFRRPAPRTREGETRQWWTTDALEDYQQFGYYYARQKPSDVEDPADGIRAVELINNEYGWFGDPDNPLRDIPVQPYLMPNDYANWAEDYPCFVDNPALLPDDTQSMPESPRPPPPPPVVMPSLPESPPLVGMAPLSFVALSRTAVLRPAAALGATHESAETPAVSSSSNGDENALPEHKLGERVPPTPHEILVAEATQAHALDWTPPAKVVDQGKLRLWHFNFAVTRRAFRGTFQIFVFIGDFPEDWNQWAAEPHLVSTEGVFTTHEPDVDDDTAPVGSMCANCALQEQTGQDYSDFTPLTKMLVDYTRSRERQPPGADGMILESLEPDDVVPFLRRNLHWRVLGPKGPVDRADTPGLQVTVSSQVMTLPKTAKHAPAYSDEVLYLDITDGRPSGIGAADF